MNWRLVIKFLTVFQLIDLSQHSCVQDARQRIRAEVRGVIGGQLQQHHHSAAAQSPHHYEHHHENSARRVHRVRGGHPHRHRWSSGHRKSMEHHHFTGWSAWSICNGECIKRRERYCKSKRKCGFTKHVEERKCWHCHPTIIWPQQTHENEGDKSAHHHEQQQQQTINHGGSPPQSIIINAAAASSGTPQQLFVLPTQQPRLPPMRETIVHHRVRMPVLQEIVAQHQLHHHQLHEQHHEPHSSYEEDDDFAANGQYDSQQMHPTENFQPEPEILTDEEDVLATAPPQLTYLPNSIENADIAVSDGGGYDAYDAYDDNNSNNSNNDDSADDFYVLNTRPKFKKRRQPKPIYIDAADYAELEAEEFDDLPPNHHQQQQQQQQESSEELDASVYHDTQFGPVHSIRSHQRQARRLQRHRRPRQRNLLPNTENGVEGDTFQYEDFDFDQNAVSNADAGSFGYGYTKLDNQYNDSYEDTDYGEAMMTTLQRNSSSLIPSKEKATPDALIPRHRRLYSKWSRWTKCSPKCTTRRYKKCRVRESCGREVLREIAYCYTEGSFCQQWLQAQVQRAPPYELRPLAASRRRDISVDNSGTQSNSIDGDFIMNSKGYRGPEYTPMKLKCGIAPIRTNHNNNKRNMYNMLKIIGGKASRKGEWPWQVAIFNRFKEAFCGGTLIAPHWVLTAAHCVRKVLYVRIGEHNLDYEDGTELQLRVLKSFKHPNFDKKTVDSDVALLKLPKPINTTTWIGFSCLPRPYQPLPKNVDCTVIGWGKRRNRDAAGTSVLHQAEVPIISMDNCRQVYQDYTITKNMFCAGHKRGRIDTCAGDSGGPLLCRDTTKPNHPWTIFGITSFGDGCAKRNKFGIYAKVPNYVDWVWSVINCNGNCKLHQRSFG